MTIERPMFPPRRDNPFRLVGGTEATVSPPAKRRGRRPIDREIDDEPEVPTCLVDFRTREGVKAHIDEHIKARDAYAKAAAWKMAAEAQNLPVAQIDQAQNEAWKRYLEMLEAGRRLLIVMPTDPKGLVDLLLYLEKNFTVLPPEITHAAGTTHSLAFDLLRTMRLSLRPIARYGKYDKSEEDDE
jgi:hypothetical protein